MRSVAQGSSPRAVASLSGCSIAPRPDRWLLGCRARWWPQLARCCSGAGPGVLAGRVTSMRTSHTCEVAGLCYRSTRAHAIAESARIRAELII